MLVELDDEHTKCSICFTKFSTDTDNKDPEIRKHLPVLSSSQRCDHWFCHGCILKEQLRVAEENNGKLPKWLKCMRCREKTSFNPAEPKYHRLLIDLLGRANDYAAAKVKEERHEEQNIEANAAPVNIKIESDFDIVGNGEEHALSHAKLVQIEEREEGKILQSDVRDTSLYGTTSNDKVVQSTTDFDSRDQQQHVGKVDQVCSVCKEVKVLNCFSRKQLAKEDSAKCKDCILDYQNKKMMKLEIPRKKKKADVKRRGCTRCKAAEEKPHVIYSHCTEDCALYDANGKRKLGRNRRRNSIKSDKDKSSDKSHSNKSVSPASNVTQQNKTPCSRCMKNGKAHAAKNHTDHQCRTYDSEGNKKKSSKELQQELQSLKNEVKELSRSQSGVEERNRSSSLRSRSRSRSNSPRQSHNHGQYNEPKEQYRRTRSEARGHNHNRSSRRRSYSRSRSRSRSRSSSPRHSQSHGQYIELKEHYSSKRSHSSSRSQYRYRDRSPSPSELSIPKLNWSY